MANSNSADHTYGLMDDVDSRPGSEASFADTDLNNFEMEEEVVEESFLSVEDQLESSLKELEEENTSEVLEGKLADLCGRIITKGVSDEKLKSILEKYLPPANCTMMSVVRVNPPIWQLLNPATRSLDIKQSKDQQMSAKALVSIAKAMEEVREQAKHNTALNGTFAKLVDAFTLVAQVNRNTNLKRRELIKPDLNPAFRHICAPTVPITSLLFGDDLEGVIKSQTEANKVKLQLGNTSRGRPPFRGVAQGRVQKFHGRGFTSRAQVSSNRGFPRGRGQPRGQGRAQPKGYSKPHYKTSQ